MSVMQCVQEIEASVIQYTVTQLSIMQLACMK